MLTRLHLSNIQIVETADLSFAPGLTAITGETGSGKSLLFRAICSLMDPPKADGWLHPSSDRGSITLVFDVQQRPDVVLEGETPPHDVPWHVERTWVRHGRGRCTLNGQPIPQSSCQRLLAQLVVALRQHDQARWLQAGGQRDSLDAFAGHHDLLGTVAGCYRSWQDAEQDVARWSTLLEGGTARQELLAFYCEELDAASPQPGEVETLHERITTGHRQLADAQTLRDHLDALEGTSAILPRLKELDRRMTGKLGSEPSTTADVLDVVQPWVANALDALEQAAYHLARAQDDLPHPERLAEDEARLSALYALARKHDVQPDDVYEHHQQLRNDLSNIDQAAERLDAARQAATHHQAAYREACERLHTSRVAHATDVMRAVQQQLPALGLAHAQCSLTVLPHQAPAGHGTDTVQWLFSANPEHPLMPIQDTASGGERSRMVFAIHAALAARLPISTWLVDEADTGMSGQAADAMGQRLATLAARQPILCITHSPQVAAHADHHVHVTKDHLDGQTQVRFATLDASGRHQALARLISGKAMGQATFDHAKSLVQDDDLSP